MTKWQYYGMRRQLEIKLGKMEWAIRRATENNALFFYTSLPVTPQVPLRCCLIAELLEEKFLYARGLTFGLLVNCQQLNLKYPTDGFD